MKTLLWLLLPLPLLCQTANVTLDFSPQGPVVLKDLTGKVIPGMQVVTCMVCADVVVQGWSGGKVYNAATDAGFTWTSDLSVQPVLDGIVQRNWKTITMQLLTRGALLAAEITSGGIIKVTSSVTTGLIIGHDVSDQTIAFLKDRLTNSAPLTQNLWQANQNYDIVGCKQGYMMARWSKASPMGPRRISIPSRTTPAPFVPAPAPFAIPSRTAQVDPDYVAHPAGWWSGADVETQIALGFRVSTLVAQKEQEQ